VTAPARHLAVTGSVLAGLAVALGAFGAHALRATLSPEDLAIFETGVRYQMYHAIGILSIRDVMVFMVEHFPEIVTPRFRGAPHYMR